ncbi:RagB/SusD family nutrient uptake outer membrane protein [Flavobacterium nitrogenifigens]|uniref:RagB/SusD domain-containing protein n=1 Tax=Flavobacterium nitrogenifigens TaxID=1617283 RepID=A0A521B480_9FLAO|nr:RagB/SusD family nutrient uptake outer membrane protein [Flavobacterium nitrogenifigens]KAF2334582.1 RagB/SusD family nutrient uptake outer membrane protein [Flavobacterium nitrogenifigens]SMO41879.1 RagB/SusD domain-containing protein [Flavobacterium nitrogenifigens]
MRNDNIKIYIYRMHFVMLWLLYGCSNFTDVDLPSSQLTSGTVFEEKSTANAAMLDVYSKIRESGILTGYTSGISSQLGLYADELQFYGASGTGLANYYNNSLVATDPQIAVTWNSSYTQIYSANAVIEGLERSKALPADFKQQLKGEALFVRALLHFYLLNLYGPVPYITSTDYKINSNAARMTEMAVYELIEKDLEQSITLLQKEYNGSYRVRPNKATAQTLLARVYLYSEKWEEASNMASTVLNQSDLYVWPTSLDLEFKKESKATIWQLISNVEGANTYQGNVFIFIQGPPPSMALTENLVNAFSSGDLRKTKWLKAVSNGTLTWYHPYKYQEKSNTATSLEYPIVFRMAELNLIRAEARARAGDLIGAKEDLNKTRNLAGLGDTAAIEPAEIIDAVLTERRLEFFTEFGHRFFDLKRLGRLDQEISPLKPQWKTTNRLLPLPQSELTLNPNLSPQNEGY